MLIPQPVIESITAVVAGSSVSFLNRFVFSNPLCSIGQECQVVERENTESKTSTSSTIASSVIVTDSNIPHNHIPHTHIPL